MRVIWKDSHCNVCVRCFIIERSIRGGPVVIGLKTEVIDALREQRFGGEVISLVTFDDRETKQVPRAEVIVWERCNETRIGPTVAVIHVHSQEDGADGRGLGGYYVVGSFEEYRGILVNVYKAHSD